MFPSRLTVAGHDVDARPVVEPLCRLQRGMSLLFSALLAILAASLWADDALAGREGELSRRGFELLMIEEPGCAYCARWMSEVAPGYRKSSEGALAPLVIRDRHDPEVKSFPRIVYTPTFILLHNGVERGRILGYAGPDFFWSMIAEMLQREVKAEADAGAEPSTQLAR